ncbi:hypothetical protein KP509_10G088800 [Ceratopteris richardii]|uniref:Exocyst subunit Exo70 family protein n=1 Tax=Ceratopteris richardii TaxID=49495 RepID=A0A8T2TZF9_CERRI|nr:hypothetical protein KP509_10G088800 [Ceratopteris richardii]
MGERLNVAEEAIMRRSSNVCLIWDGHPDDAVIYLRAVDDPQSLLGPLSSPWSYKAMLDRAHHVLQVAVQHLIEEFNVMLVTNSEPVDTEWVSYCENEPSTHSGPGGEDPHALVSDSLDDDEDEEFPLAHLVTEFNAVFDPIPPERMKDLNKIAQCIVRAGYGRECKHVYVSVRKSVLEQSLYRLGMQKIKIENVQKMTWESLEAKIKNWIQAFKSGSEKLASGALMQFLAFGKVVVGVHRTPEKLFKILDMFEIIKDLRSDINMVFYDEMCERIRTEVGIVLGQLGEAARGTLPEFELAIQKDASKIPVVGGAFHPLTRYVMNYIKFFVDYSATLEILLKDKRREVPKSLGVETFGLFETLLETIQIMWLIVYLEGNLDAKSKLYMDQSMVLLFIMNNVHYIVQKVRQSELSASLGDGWLQKHNGQVRVYAANYVRTTWKLVFSCLRDEGLTTNGRLSSGVSRVAIKDRFKNFNPAFEEACAAQSSFVVPDPQLHEDLRIAIAEKLILAYRSFLGHYGNFLETGRQPDKYLKYFLDDLKNHVIDLFDAPN